MLAFLAFLLSSAHAVQLRDAPPPVCFIKYAAPENTAVTCSGTLIAPQVVLTASHCFPNKKDIAGEVKIGCGLTSQSSKGEAFKFTEEFQARAVQINPRWKSTGSDFAFLRLNRAASRIKPMRMAESLTRFRREFLHSSPTSATDDEFRPGVECRSSGFGASGRKSLFVTSDRSPRSGLKGFLSKDPARADAFVLNSWGGRIEGLRKGDSGGPLYCRGDTGGDWQLVAVVVAGIFDYQGNDQGINFFASTVSEEFLKYWQALKKQWAVSSS